MAKNRTDIDKDIMYNKIMPSSLRQEAARPAEGAADSQAPAAAQVPAAAPLTAPRPAAPPPEEAAKPAPKPAQKSGVRISTTPSYVLVNLMEQLVLDRLDDAFEKFKCCRCDKCKKDVVALTLNKLAPKYVVAMESELMRLTALQSSTEVSTALVQALIQVRTNPRH